MKRSTIALLILLGVALMAMIAFWFFKTHEQVPVTVRVSPGAAARANPFLALERFMDRMGRPLTQDRHVERIAEFDPGGVLILGSERGYAVQSRQTALILDWVKKGGYLIVIPEVAYAEDPVLDALGIQRVHTDRSSGSTEEEEQESEDADTDIEEDEAPSAALPDSEPAADVADTEDTGVSDEEGESVPETRDGTEPVPDSQPKQQEKQEKRRPEEIAVEIPGANRVLQIRRSYPVGLDAGTTQPEWRAGEDGQPPRILHYSLGKGQVTVISSLESRLSNWNIGDLDHAEFLWTLLRLYQKNPQAPVLFLHNFERMSIWEWLLTRGRPVTISVLLLVLLWLWHLQPRFAPVLPESGTDRRALREHLAAIGRYVWKNAGYTWGLRIARERFMGRLAIRQPAWSVLPRSLLVQALAERFRHLGRDSMALHTTHDPAQQIAEALYGEASSPQQFTRIVSTLKNLENIL